MKNLSLRTRAQATVAAVLSAAFDIIVGSLAVLGAGTLVMVAMGVLP